MLNDTKGAGQDDVNDSFFFADDRRLFFRQIYLKASKGNGHVHLCQRDLREIGSYHRTSRCHVSFSIPVVVMSLGLINLWFVPEHDASRSGS